MNLRDLSEIRVAWLIPSMARGYCWLRLFEEFANIFPISMVFTGLWPPNQPAGNVAFDLNVVGKTRFIAFGENKSRYQRGIIIPPLGIPYHLLKFHPRVIFTYGFSIWTFIVLILKPLTRWRVIIVYEGSTPTVDARESRVRTFVRNLMAMTADAFITNSHAGKSYLVQFLGAKDKLVFVRPYLVPDIEYLSQKKINIGKLLAGASRPIFLYIGLVINRKGLKYLIEAFAGLRREGYDVFTLVIVGDGPQREELENLVIEYGIDKQVKWMGWVDYRSLGYYFYSSDIFVFPTYEDTWGLVVLEAMAFAKPVLCSKLAGSVEMVRNGENGFTFDPARDKPEVLSEIIKKFIDYPQLIRSMGEKSKMISLSHTPKAAANYMKYIIEFVLGWRNRNSIMFCEHPQEQD
jgi:glycosyltransferase involved in cell wall biosynthesis